MNVLVGRPDNLDERTYPENHDPAVVEYGMYIQRQREAVLLVFKAVFA
jgi:hypothetical protein